MTELTFEKVAIVNDQGQPVVTGTLTVYDDHMEIDGKKNKVIFPNVRGVESQPPRIKVTYGPEGAPAVDEIMKVAVGMPKKVRELNRQLFEQLQGVYGGVELSADEQKRMAETEDLLGEIKLRSARRSLWIGGALFVGGLAFTLITFTAASNSSGGGRYFLAYGPVLAGLGIFADAMVKIRKYGPKKRP